MSVLRLSGTLLWLAALWVALWGDLTTGNVVAGVLIGALVLGSAKEPSVVPARESAVRLNPLAIIWFLGYVLYKLVEANLVLAWEIATPRNRIRTGVVAVPLRTDSDVVMMVVANMITLTPGTITLESRGDPPVLYVHVLHLLHPDKLTKDLYTLERLVVNAFGPRRARAQLADARERERRAGIESRQDGGP